MDHRVARGRHAELRGRASKRRTEAGKWRDQTTAKGALHGGPHERRRRWAQARCGCGAAHVRQRASTARGLCGAAAEHRGYFATDPYHGEELDEAARTRGAGGPLALAAGPHVADRAAVEIFDFVDSLRPNGLGVQRAGVSQLVHPLRALPLQLYQFLISQPGLSAAACWELRVQRSVSRAAGFRNLRNPFRNATAP